VAELPPARTDPFDRMLIAQARAEQLKLLTSDAGVAAYGDGVELV
jgi:PIN domain nuclease of toxin-antitoxin system